MGIEEIVIAVGQAYLEREKAKADQAKADEIIRQIISAIIGSRQIIMDALQDFEINHLTGLFLGQVENFKEYDASNAQHKNLLLDIAFNTNGDIIGPLIDLFNNISDLNRLRKIVRLMVLTMNLRGLVYSELKNRYGDNRDDHILEQMKFLKACCHKIYVKQLKIEEDKHRKWERCQLTNKPIGTIILTPPPINEGDSVISACVNDWDEYQREKSKSIEDAELVNKVNENITHLQEN